MIRGYIKKKITDWLVKDLLRSITEEDVLRRGKDGIIRARSKKLSKEMVDQLQNEAEYINNSITFQLLMDDMEYLAHQTMFARSQSFDDMMFGKAQLYVIDVLKKKIKNLAK